MNNNHQFVFVFVLDSKTSMQTQYTDLLVQLVSKLCYITVSGSLEPILKTKTIH